MWKCVVLEGEEEAAEVAVPCAKRARTRAEPLEEPLEETSATAQASAAGPGPSSAGSHTQAPERRPCHGPGRGKLELEERLGEKEVELLAQRGKDLDRREQELVKRERQLEKTKRAGLGKGKGEINFIACF